MIDVKELRRKAAEARERKKAEEEKTKSEEEAALRAALELAPQKATELRLQLEKRMYENAAHGYERGEYCFDVRADILGDDLGVYTERVMRLLLEQVPEEAHVSAYVDDDQDICVEWNLAEPDALSDVNGARTPFDHLRVRVCSFCGFRSGAFCALDPVVGITLNGMPPPKDCKLRKRALIVYLDPADWDGLSEAEVRELEGLEPMP